MNTHHIDPMGWKGFYERFAAPVLARDRFFIGLVIALLVAAMEAGALFALVPLHSVVPYVIRTNSEGRVISSGLASPSTLPAKAEITYWLSRFVRDLYEVEPGVSKKNVKQAFYMTRGAGVVGIEAFFKKYNPVQIAHTDPLKRVTVKIDTFTRLPHGEAYITATLHSEPGATQRSVALTISYEIHPPTTVQDAMRNPIGIQITNFIEEN